MTDTKRTYLVPFLLVTSLFFLWAFVHNLEPILIPHLKKACQLSDLQSALIDSAVYIGYFLMALPAGMVMKKYGYKRGILIGLLLYAIGALMFLPAADSRIYAFFLAALFIIASGCAFLETAANPYVTMLGDPGSANTRLNFAQSFNGLGAFLAPMLGGKLILSGVEYTDEQLKAMNPDQLNLYLQGEADAVQMPYLVIAGVVMVVATLIYIYRMPETNRPASSVSSDKGLSGALRHPQLRWGVVAQFFYVGAQVCVTSFFIRFAKFTSATPEKEAAYLLGLALLGFMLGRFAGTWLSRTISANRLLASYALISMALLCVAAFGGKGIALWALIAVPFFESIMFPTIFALAIDGIGEDTEIGSSLVVMAIAGGALFPVIMGYISDATGSIQLAYAVPLLCFAVVAWYGWRGYRRIEY